MTGRRVQEESIDLFSPPTIDLRVSGMLLPIPRVSPSQLLIMGHKKVLSIVLLGSLGEIEATGNHGFAVNDHDLVVGDGMNGVYLDGYPIIEEEGGRGILGGPLAFIEDNPHLDSPLMGIHHGFGNWSRCERIDLNEDDGLGFVQLPDDGIGAASVWREIDFPCRWFILGEGDGWR